MSLSLSRVVAGAVVAGACMLGTCAFALPANAAVLQEEAPAETLPAGVAGREYLALIEVAESIVGVTFEGLPAGIQQQRGIGTIETLSGVPETVGTYIVTMTEWRLPDGGQLQKATRTFALAVPYAERSVIQHVAPATYRTETAELRCPADAPWVRKVAGNLSAALDATPTRLEFGTIQYQYEPVSARANGVYVELTHPGNPVPFSVDLTLHCTSNPQNIYWGTLS
jgi:hypothetical protein